MANNATKISALNACTTPVAADVVVMSANVAGNAVSYQVTFNNFFANAAANVSVNVATSATMAVTGNSTPANNTDNSDRPNNAIWADDNYIYVWNGTEIKRAALSTF